MRPRERFDLQPLRWIWSTGSPLSDAGFAWIYDEVKRDVHLASISGGTDILSCFLGGSPTEPVFAGELQRPSLGSDVKAYDATGSVVVETAGELVCRTPMPSMPIGIWNDPEGTQLHDTYFAQFPGAWHHGDLIEETANGGFRVLGRSDATLKPGGVRVGTAEIYRALEAVSEISDAAAVGKSLNDDVEIWLFVVLEPGHRLDLPLERRIADVLLTQASPSHVPAKILQVDALPKTHTGKLMEGAVRRIVNGERVANWAAVGNPESLDAVARATAALAGDKHGV